MCQLLTSVSIKDLNGSDTTCGDFWDNHINSKENTVKGVLYNNLKKKNPTIHIDQMAEAMTHIAGIESNASVASTKIQNAMMNIATTGTVLNAIKKAGAGISGIDLSNDMAAQQSLASNMVDATGQFKWMIKIVPVIEYLIFGMLLYLGIPMGMVAGFMGASRGGKMIMNYAFGLIAFSFIDVGLAIVQSVSYYYYSHKAIDMVVMLGQSPFTITSLPPYLQNMAYMSGVMGWAAIIVAPLTVGVVFKGETMAAMGAYNAVMGMYKGDKGGQNLSSSLSRSAGAHSAEAQDYERYAREKEEHAKRNLSDWGIVPPKGALASEMWKEVSSQAEQFGSDMGVANYGQRKYGSLENLSATTAKAGFGQGKQNIIKSISEGLGAGVMLNSPEAEDNYAYQTQTDAEKSIAGTITKGKESKEIPGLSRDNQIKAVKAEAGKSLADEVGAGQGLMDTDAFDKNGNLINNKATKAMIKGSELSSLQKANMQIGTGEEGDVAAYSKVALQDGQIAGKTVNAINKRRSELNGKKGTEKWDEDKIADGQAISSVQQQIKMQGISNALSKEGQNNDDAFRQAAMGSEFSGRKEENDQLGIGKKWTKETATGNDIKDMAMEQDNAAVSAIGGIKATHAEIAEHKQPGLDIVDSAIKDMITGGEEKGIMSAANAHKLRENYGEHLDSDHNKAGETLAEHAKERLGDAKKDAKDAQKEIDEDKAYLNDPKNQTSGNGVEMQKHQDSLEAAKAKLETAQGDISTNQALIDSHPENMSLKDVASLSAESKIASMAGQAAGIKENIDKGGVSYAENAMYSEESRQQSTKAKIDAQGGVESAVNTDVADASVKAAMQQQGLKGSLSEYLQNKDGEHPRSKEEAEKMAQAILSGGSQAAEAMKSVLASAGGLAFAQGAGKTSSDLATVNTYKSPEEYAQAQAQKASAMATVDKTRYEKSMDQAIDQKKLDAMRKDANDKDLFDKQMVNSGAAVMGKDGKLIATTGSKFTNGLSAIGAGDMASTTQLIVGGERMNVDTDLDGNTFVNRDSSENIKRGRSESIGATGYLEQAFGKTGEALLLGGTGVGMAERLYRKFGPKGNDGLVKPVFKKAANGLADIIGADEPFPKSPKETIDGTGNSDNGKPTNGTNNEQKNGIQHGTSPNSDTNSIAKNGETRKFISDGFGGMKPNPDYVEPKPPKFISEALKSKSKAFALAGAGMFAGYEAYEHFAGKDFKQDVSDFGNFMTTDHSPKGGSGQTPGSVGYKGTGGNQGVSASDAVGTAFNLAAYATPVVSALFGSDAGNDSYGGDELRQVMARQKVPQHAQKAFTQTTGENTLSAMKTQLVQPIQGQEVASAKPVQPTQGIKPTETVQPAQPIQGQEVQQPVQPTESVKPTETVQPAQPIQGQEVASAKPVQGQEAQQPVQPTEGVKPTETVQPQQPEQYQEVASAKPVQPTESVKPSETAQQTQPIQGQEVASAKPIQPTEGVKPAETVQPEQPVQPEQYQEVASAQPIQGQEAQQPSITTKHGSVNVQQEQGNQTVIMKGADTQSVVNTDTQPGTPVINTDDVNAQQVHNVQGTQQGTTNIQDQTPRQPVQPTESVKPSETVQPVQLTEQARTVDQAQQFAAQPTGSGTPHIIPSEATAQNTGSIASNMETLSALTQSRSGGFTLQNGQGEPVSFTTSKAEGHPLQVNNQDTGISYDKFSSMMQNNEMASQFGSAIASSGINNTDTYNTANSLLLDMTQQQKMADRRMRVSNNAADTNRSMQHKEMLETIKGSDKEDEEY